MFTAYRNFSKIFMASVRAGASRPFTTEIGASPPSFAFFINFTTFASPLWTSNDEYYTARGKKRKVKNGRKKKKKGHNNGEMG